MADVTGALHHKHGEKTYTLRLTLGGIAKLQGKHGNDLAGVLTGAQAIPSFAVLLDIVAESLRRGGDVESEDADALADEMLTVDKKLVERLLHLAFPEAPQGNAPAPKDVKA